MPVKRMVFLTRTALVVLAGGDVCSQMRDPIRRSAGDPHLFVNRAQNQASRAGWLTGRFRDRLVGRIRNTTIRARGSSTEIAYRGCSL
ncbi:MAG: hypothetical protein CMJ70_13365 [Planctomycetaceae bacterium]|nr:hypothetical protein [Planctomycetaceae bacterium]HAA71490.1 hypothetical protein [Planctomycetaceae bacterium]